MGQPQRIPRISAVILNYNTRELLVNCLRALAGEKPRTDIEVLVVDNASDDGSADAVRQRFPNVALLANDQNLLYARGMNLGASQARGEFVVFLNVDTEVSADQLEALGAYLRQHPQVGAVGPLQMRASGKLERPRRHDLSLVSFLAGLIGLESFLGRISGRPVSGEVAWLSGSCLMVRRDLGARIGFFDAGYPLYWEDRDLSRRIREYGYELHLLTEVAIVHHHGASTGQVDRGQRRRWEAQGFVRYVRKHYSHGYGSVIVGVRLALCVLGGLLRGAVALATFGLLKHLAPAGESFSVARVLWARAFTDAESAQREDTIEPPPEGTRASERK